MADDRDSASRDLTAPRISAYRESELRERFLGRLGYPSMNDRQERIQEAHEATFRWLFVDAENTEMKWSNFKSWLQSNDQLYWITGKAGSGKSTLMKYVSATGSRDYGVPRCREDLELWSSRESPHHLVVAAFYFWNSGTPLQMSQMGLFRALLHQILTELPELIAKVAPKIWEALCLFDTANLGFSDTSELQKILRAVAQSLPDDVKLCLFVDGLDEFDGDHLALIALLNELLSNPNIKLCVASRPWVVFEDAFGHRPHLRLEFLTYNDIKAYVCTHLEADPCFTLLRRREAVYAAQLVENIISKASGVFLWIRLVVTSLLAGMSAGDRVSDMQRRLDILPPELERLCEKILDSLDPFYLEHAAQLFRLI